MLYYLRNLAPIELDEFTAEVVAQALEWHHGHLTNEAREARDRADRPAWALGQFRLHAASRALSAVRHGLRDLGPMPVEAAERHAELIRNRARKMPQSAANARVLRAERAVRIEAEKERKAAYWRRVEAGRRMAGGKWSRPIVTDATATTRDGMDETLPDVGK